MEPRSVSGVGDLHQTAVGHGHIIGPSHIVGALAVSKGVKLKAMTAFLGSPVVLLFLGIGNGQGIAVDCYGKERYEENEFLKNKEKLDLEG